MKEEMFSSDYIKALEVTTYGLGHLSEYFKNDENKYNCLRPKKHPNDYSYVAYIINNPELSIRPHYLGLPINGFYVLGERDALGYLWDIRVLPCKGSSLKIENVDYYSVIKTIFDYYSDDTVPCPSIPLGEDDRSMSDPFLDTCFDELSRIEMFKFYLNKMIKHEQSILNTQNKASSSLDLLF